MGSRNPVFCNVPGNSLKKRKGMDLQSDSNCKPAIFGGKSIKGIMLLAECHNRTCADSMAFFTGLWKPVSSDDNTALIGISNFEHKCWFVDTFDSNFSFILG